MRSRYALLSTYAQRGAPATPLFVDPLAPARAALAPWSSGAADVAWLLHVASPAAHRNALDAGVRLVDLAQPLALLHRSPLRRRCLVASTDDERSRYGDELRRGLEPLPRWSLRVVYADGASGQSAPRRVRFRRAL